MKEIIYDVFDHSFRYELFMLDRLLCPDIWAEDPALRTNLIAAVFGCTSVLAQWADPFPNVNMGLTAIDYRDRKPYIEAFRLLLVNWPSAPMLPPLPVDASLDDTVLLEKKIALFYCQRFFDSYGCPPILPHHIPFEHRIYTI